MRVCSCPLCILTVCDLFLFDQNTRMDTATMQCCMVDEKVGDVLDLIERTARDNMGQLTGKVDCQTKSLVNS